MGSDFNPRTPHGVRLNSVKFICPSHPFQSTHPTRGATRPKGFHHTGNSISIHAPHTGCDSDSVTEAAHGIRFQSTHPTRGATRTRGQFHRADIISIHAPHTGCDPPGKTPQRQRTVISIHAPHTGCDDRYLASGAKRY